MVFLSSGLTRHLANWPRTRRATRSMNSTFITTPSAVGTITSRQAGFRTSSVDTGACPTKRTRPEVDHLQESSVHGPVFHRRQVEERAVSRVRVKRSDAG